MRTWQHLLLAVTIPTVALGAEKETPPAGTAPKPFRLPATEDFTLTNGLRVTLVPYGVVPKTVVRAFVEAGGVNEAANQVWLSRLTARMLKEGTTTRTSSQLAQEAARMGGQLEVQSGAEFTSAGGTVLTEFGSSFVGLVADMLENASLPAAELPRLKADLIRQLAVEKAEPNALARERFLQVLFPNHPYGRLYPTSAGLQALRIEDVQNFYSQQFGASRTHLYVAGKLDPGLRSAVENAFRSWTKGQSATVAAAEPVKARSVALIDRPGAAQSTIYLGLPVANPQSPDYVMLDVMDSLLGSSFGSRITANIREQKGYTYSPFSQIGTRKNLAYWVEAADVTTAVTGPSLKEIFYEVDRLRKEPPPAAELAGIQSYLAGLFVLKNTVSPSAIINQLHFVDAQGLDRSFLSTYVQKVVAVKPQDIQRVAETYLVPSKMTIVVVGDQAKIAEQVKPYQQSPAQ